MEPRLYTLSEVVTIVGLVVGFVLTVTVFLGLFTGRVIGDPVKRNWLMGTFLAIGIVLLLDIVTILGYGGLLPLLISAGAIVLTALAVWSFRAMDFVNKLAFGQAALIIFLVNWLVLTKRYLI
ncbi:MAG: hypothetical protein HYX24_06530 [Candidatus Aenigmarchaeota archaeon]|nr:hypothetical protein [Candidatus Aenigmarchaeota archaeon]